MQAKVLLCKVATTEAERLAAFRLRYQVYVLEMAKPYRDVDSAGQLLTDGLDQTAVQFILLDSAGVVVGAVRCNFARDALNVLPLASRLMLHRIVPDCLERVTVCSRLVVASAHRHRGALNLLVRGIYRWGLERDIEVNLIHTALPLVPLFSHLGFREFGDDFIDEEAGSEQQPLYLILKHESYLRETGSPFLADLLEARRERTTHHELPWRVQRIIEPIVSALNGRLASTPARAPSA